MTMTKKGFSKETFPQKWRLDTIFETTTEKNNMASFLKNFEKNFADLTQAIEKKDIKKATAILQKLYQDLYTLSAYACCLFSENVQNTEAALIQETYRHFQSLYDKLTVQYDLLLKNFSDEAFDQLLQDPELFAISFYLKEKKALSQHLLSLKEENLICDLSIDGYHGFSQLFDTLHGHLRFDIDGENLSYGQIENKLSSPHRAERIKAFYSFKKVFQDQENIFAQILNHIAGFRWKVYEKRQWEDPLFEPLQNNRMQPKTLQAMMSAIEDIAPFLKQYLQRKAKLLDLDALTWHDIAAPLGKTEETIPYEEGCALILEQFSKLSGDLKSFAEKALTSQWVDAENRDHKAAGGFCTGFPLSKESRIFMTYSGTKDNVATLAHELGHAYHNEQIFSLPPFAQVIKMNIAETASTMAEMIVSDALFQKAKSSQEKILALDDKISRAVAFCMNLKARFIFEKDFYHERKKGYVLPEKLNFFMERAQKQAYLDSLSEYHPHFWASKLHFYFTDEPFYNFPYIFGFLFSLSAYQQLKDDPKTFETTFQALLKDSAQMTVEDLAQKHLKADLTSKTFWKTATDHIVSDIKQFLAFTEKDIQA